MSTSAPPSRRRSIFKKARGPQGPAYIRPDGSRDVELPLVEHLRELRSRIIKSVAVVIITTMLSLTFAEQEVSVLVRLAQGHNLISLEPTETFVSYLKVAFFTG